MHSRTYPWWKLCGSRLKIRSEREKLREGEREKEHTELFNLGSLDEKREKILLLLGCILSQLWSVLVQELQVEK